MFSQDYFEYWNAAKFVSFILLCLNLSRFRSLIFNPFTNQRELAEPLSIPYSSCTSKATTTPRRTLIHLQPIEAFANHHKNRKREELIVIIWYLELWSSRDKCLFVFFCLSSSYLHVVQVVLLFYVFNLIWILF